MPLMVVVLEHQAAVHVATGDLGGRIDPHAEVSALVIEQPCKDAGRVEAEERLPLTDPSVATSAAELQSDSRAWSPMGRMLIGRSARRRKRGRDAQRR